MIPGVTFTCVKIRVERIFRPGSVEVGQWSEGSPTLWQRNPLWCSWLCIYSFIIWTHTVPAVSHKLFSLHPGWGVMMMMMMRLWLNNHKNNTENIHNKYKHCVEAESKLHGCSLRPGWTLLILTYLPAHVSHNSPHKDCWSRIWGTYIC